MTKGAFAGVGALVTTASAPATTTLALTSTNTPGSALRSSCAVAPGSMYVRPTITLLSIPSLPLAVLKSDPAGRARDKCIEANFANDTAVADKPAQLVHARTAILCVTHGVYDTDFGHQQVEAPKPVVLHAAGQIIHTSGALQLRALYRAVMMASWLRQRLCHCTPTCSFD